MSDLDTHVDQILAERRKRGRSSKRKGARGENLVRDLAIQAGFTECLRSFASGATGGGDLIGIPGLSIECKAVEKLNVQKAYDQACAAARPTETPIVAHKRARREWLVTLDLRTFLELYKQATNGEASVRGP